MSPYNPKTFFISYATLLFSESSPSLGLVLPLSTVEASDALAASSDVIGCTSTLMGAVLGIGLCWGQQTFGWITLDGAVSIVPTLPVVIDPAIVIFAIASSLFLCVLATIYPARRAASMAIAENIAEQ